jgi:hypothetical protein
MFSIFQLMEQALQLVSKDVKMSDEDLYIFRDQLRKLKSKISAKRFNYFELILDRSIDLSDAIKESETPWGNDLFSLREQRKHLNWLERRKEFLKTILDKRSSGQLPKSLNR